MKSKKRERGNSTGLYLALSADVVSCHSTVSITSDYQVGIDDSREVRPVIDFQAKMTTLKKWDFECVLLSF